jgi:hypothetical protein
MHASARMQKKKRATLGFVAFDNRTTFISNYHILILCYKRTGRLLPVETALKVFPGKSDRAIAEHVRVSVMTVGRIRPTCNNVALDRRTGRDGKSYPAGGVGGAAQTGL